MLCTLLLPFLMTTRESVAIHPVYIVLLENVLVTGLRAVASLLQCENKINTRKIEVEKAADESLFSKSMMPITSSAGRRGQPRSAIRDLPTRD